MHGPAADAITVMLFGLSGFFLWGAALSWLKAARDREGPDERPSIPVSAFRSAAVTTAIAFMLLGASAIWLALVSLP